MADIYTLIQTALVNKLLANSSIAAGGGVWELPAPEDVPYPFYTFFPQSLTDMNQSPRRGVEALFLVECWSDSLSQVRAGAGYIDTALHDQELTISGWSNWRLTHDSILLLPPEQIAGRLIYRRGGVYRISIDRNNS